MSDAKPRRTIRESVRSGSPDPNSSAARAAGAAPDIAPSPAEASIDTAAPATVPAAWIEPAVPPAEDPYLALGEVQAALARGFEHTALAITAFVGSGIAAAADAGIALLAARTLAEAGEINARLVRRRTDELIDGSTRLSEIAAKAATEASQAMLAPLGKLWGGGVLG